MEQAMNSSEKRDLAVTRRHFIRSAGISLGSIACASLLDQDLFSTALSDTHGLQFPAKAKHIIFLCQDGAPSQLDLFDYKPKLQ